MEMEGGGNFRPKTPTNWFSWKFFVGFVLVVVVMVGNAGMAWRGVAVSWRQQMLVTDLNGRLSLPPLVVDVVVLGLFGSS